MSKEEASSESPRSVKIRCSRCERSEAPDRLLALCEECGSPLLVDYGLTGDPELRIRMRSRARGMWRYREVLPLPSSSTPVTLGEGDTPLLSAMALGARLGLDRLFVKDESQNPTRSFKARGMSVAVTMAKHLGAESLAVPTAGNAGCSLAAYGARAGLPVFIAMPRDTPASIARECRRYGADVELVDGFITHAARRVKEHVATRGGFELSTLREPYRIEGKKIMGYELLEDLGRLPDVILYPTGGGTGLIGMWKAFEEMERLGWVGPERPRMIAVQSSGCAPIVRAFASGLETAAEWENPSTEVWGLRVPRAIGDRLILTALRASGGLAIAASEEVIESRAAELRSLEGIDAGPEAGAALAALAGLVSSGRVQRHETIVLFNTGGDKYHD